jgi:DNA topoisomerase-1
MNVVVVESPSKAKTINKYLGDAYTVLASYGHVRDLPPKDGSVRPDEDFEMDWSVDARSEKQIDAIIDALDGAETLYLATDPDREGEAISWHIEQLLRDRGLLDNIEVKRVVFNEITKGAVQDAFNHPRGLNDELVEAYLARRALDYLVGFNLSPVLWRKLPGSRSAGRVQSVALRLICEREAEIEAFKAREYWTIEVGLDSAKGAPYQARLVERNGTKLERFDLADEGAANAARSEVEAASFKIASIEKKRTRRNPQPPFTTSTLQQEASRKLGFGASQTMRVAQRLYEGVEIDGETVGLITYMRTDSVTLSQEAIASCRDLIDQDFGNDYLPEKPRVYRTRAKNAQEAHEAVRPTDLFRRPGSLKSVLDGDLFRLYELIWRRTLASEMAEAQIDRVAVDLRSADSQLALRANGQTIAFDGFLKLYREDKDDDPANGDGDATENDDERRLPPLEEGEPSAVREVNPEQHFTQPPPRYSEASLVKTMEELGIGRPSTYASIIQVLQDRKYVQLDRKRFVPEDQGRLVTSFLSSFFERYVQYDFTARMEERLDDISGGRIDWKAVLREFWQDFSAAIDGTAELRVRSVLDALDEELGPHFFPTREDGSDARVCPACSEGRLGLRIGKHGPFVGCSNYPECKYTRKLAVDGGDDETADLANGPRELGKDPETGKDVTLRKGPYGLYVQLGELEGEGKKATKPKRSSIPDGYSLDEIELELALGLLALPRDIGPHPEDGVMIQAGLGRYGPYVKHGTVYASLPDPREVLTVGLNRAVTVLAEKGKGRRGRAAPLKELGNHPDDDKPVTVHDGRYGPYVKHGKINATIPKDADPADMTLEVAVELIAARAAKKKAAPVKKKTTKKPAKKTAAKKKAAAKKKTAAKTDSPESADTAPGAE